MNALKFLSQSQSVPLSFNPLISTSKLSLHRPRTLQPNSRTLPRSLNWLAWICGNLKHCPPGHGTSHQKGKGYGPKIHPSRRRSLAGYTGVNDISKPAGRGGNSSKRNEMESGLSHRRCWKILEDFHGGVDRRVNFPKWRRRLNSTIVWCQKFIDCWAPLPPKIRKKGVAIICCEQLNPGGARNGSLGKYQPQRENYWMGRDDDDDGWQTKPF